VGIKFLTQLLALEAMALMNTGTDGASEFHEAAALLQQQLIYNDQVLDGLHVYKDGTQSLMFLRSSIHLVYTPMQMLEKWTKSMGNGMYVHYFLEVRMCLEVRTHRNKSDNKST